VVVLHSLAEAHSMENEKTDDQNRDGNTEKPQQTVFHLNYSLVIPGQTRTRPAFTPARGTSKRHPGRRGFRLPE
jgi:hypothetical protein